MNDQLEENEVPLLEYFIDLQQLKSNKLMIKKKKEFISQLNIYNN